MPQKFKSVSPKVDFPALEQKILNYWAKNDITGQYLKKNINSKEYFSFLDGPITANNPMGVHHAWGRTNKDLWQRFNNMKGKKQRFQNGFDCQGLWVEVEVEKELGFKSKKDIEKYGVANFVNKCKERVLKYSQIQANQSKRLGYFMDWDHSYYTMSEENNYMIWHFLKVCFDKGWIYKGKDSVPWCPRCETAISQHEMLTEDYKEVTHDSVYFQLPITDSKDTFLLVWTTTPWTIPANIAVAVDKKIDYALIQNSRGFKYWIAKDLIKSVFAAQDVTTIKTVKGEKLVGLKYSGPFDDLPAVSYVFKQNKDKFHRVYATDDTILPISTMEGTGLVHTAVSAGAEDFKLGKKYGLPMIPVIADNADYLDGLGFLTGKNAKKHPEIILNYLSDVDKGKYLFKTTKYKHRYPACWRCKTELVWKVEDEWYIAMDKKDTQLDSKTFRQKMQTVVKNIHWIPPFGLERELDWLKNMHDWLISKKNRYWGLALPIYECKNCGSFEVIGSKDELHQRATEGWDKFAGNSPHKPWIDFVKINCRKCSQPISRIPDVGNPWLDAGIVPYSTISQDNGHNPLYLTNKAQWRKWFPLEFITESFPGQFKNWFYALIAMSTALENQEPFKTVLGYAILLAEDGRPMHKSWGNMIEFNTGADKIGVDVMRWMYVRHNPANNLLFGFKHADEIRRRFHLILWNCYNYFVTYAAHFGFVPKTKINKSTNILDQWILSSLTSLLIAVEKSLNQYDSSTAALQIEKFVTDLSTWYIRSSRDRVTQTASVNDRDQFLSTLYEVLANLALIIAPLQPFISEEIYTNLTENISVHLENWPSLDNSRKNQQLEEEMKQLRFYVEAFHSLRKQHNIKLRIPIKSAQYLNNKEFTPQLEHLLASELNIKKIQYHHTKTPDKSLWKVSFTQNNLLLQEGEAREIVRQVQKHRKEMNLSLEDKIVITLESWPHEYENFIKERTLAIKIDKGPLLTVKKI